MSDSEHPLRSLVAGKEHTIIEKEMPKLCISPQSRFSSCLYPKFASSSSSWASIPTSFEGRAFSSGSTDAIVASMGPARAEREGGVVVLLHILGNNHGGIAGFGLYSEYKNAGVTKEQNR